jgi:hypothetical protein
MFQGRIEFMFRRVMALAGSVGIAAAVLATTGSAASASLSVCRTQNVPPVMFENIGSITVCVPPSDAVAIVGSATINTDSDSDVPAAVDVTGGTGTFTFNSLACAGFSGNGTDVELPEAGICSANGGGTFANVVCGTGNVTGGTANITGPADTGALGFNIFFAGTVGIVTVTSDSLVSPDDNGVSDGELGFGVVVITAGARSTALDTGDCTDKFTFVTADYLGENAAS